MLISATRCSSFPLLPWLLTPLHAAYALKYGLEAVSRSISCTATSPSLSLSSTEKGPLAFSSSLKDKGKGKEVVRYAPHVPSTPAFIPKSLADATKDKGKGKEVVRPVPHVPSTPANELGGLLASMSINDMGSLTTDDTGNNLLGKPRKPPKQELVVDLKHSLDREESQQKEGLA
ncbi:hypothetical protein PG984_006536 [Apiospora sp. TS-2023a]